MELSWSWWLEGLVPPLETLEVSIDVAHPDDGTGGMVFPTAPRKALGSLHPSMQVGQGLMPPECCWTWPTVLTATFGGGGVVCDPVETDGINHSVHLNHTAWPDLCGLNPAPKELGPHFLSSQKTCTFVGWMSSSLTLRHLQEVTVHLCTGGDSLHLETPLHCKNELSV